MRELNLLFDLDGTLADSGPGIQGSLRHALARCGAPLSAQADLRWCVGPPLQDIFARLLGPERAEQVPEAIACYREHYAAHGRFESRVYAGIPEALERLADHAVLYVATVKPRDLAADMLEHFGLRGHFRAVHGSPPEQTAAGGSPNQGDHSKEVVIAGLLAQERIAADSAVMIGDRGPDMAGARRHGLRAVGVAWGFGSEAELRASGAQAIVRTPAELAASLGFARPSDGAPRLATGRP